MGKGTKVHEVPHFPQPEDSRAHRIRKRVKIAARKEMQDTEKRDKIVHVMRMKMRNFGAAFWFSRLNFAHTVQREVFREHTNLRSCPHPLSL